MLSHCGIHLAVSLILTLPYLNLVWIDAGGIKLRGWMCLLLLIFVHLLEDEWRVYVLSKRSGSDNTASFMFDQLIHFFAIFFISPDFTLTENGFVFPEKWVILAALFVMVTHAMTVLIYFIEKDFYGTDFPGSSEKYIAMVERTVLWGFLLLPGYWWAPFLVLWLGHIVYLRKKRILDFSKAGALMGIALTLVIGVLGRRTL